MFIIFEERRKERKKGRRKAYEQLTHKIREKEFDRTLRNGE